MLIESIQKMEEIVLNRTSENLENLLFVTLFKDIFQKSSKELQN
jgi:hypothetical protein